MLMVLMQYRFEVLPRIPCSTEALSSFVTSASQFEVCLTCDVYRVTVRYRDGAGNTVEENSSVFSLIRMR